MAGNNSKARSESQDIEDDSDMGSPPPSSGGKPGRKKNPNSQAARRDQNRIAQREFRLRKQQRIRDLEARVEILSGGSDNAMNEMRMILKDLMDENTALRSLVKGLSTFIGGGTPETIAKLGWKKPEFDEFVNRAPSDTVYDAWQKRKAAGTSGPGGPPSSSAGHGGAPLKRRSEDGPGGDDAGAKRARTGSDMGGGANGAYTGGGYAGSAPSPTGGMYGGAAQARSPHDTSLFSQLMRGSGAAMFTLPSGQHSPPAYAPSSAGPSPVMPPPGGPYSQSSYAPPPPPNVGLPSSLGTMSYTGGPMHQPRIQHSAARTPLDDGAEEEEEDPKKEEAMKLVAYHMGNFLRNSDYCLPASLRATDIQKRIGHGHILDGIPIPDLRDHMILLQDKYDAAECLHDFHRTVRIHGDDVLSHGNWELSEDWLRRYSFLVDQGILDLTNRWRRERGDRELTLEDIGPGNRLRQA